MSSSARQVSVSVVEASNSQVRGMNVTQNGIVRYNNPNCVVFLDDFPRVISNDDARNGVFHLKRATRKSGGEEVVAEGIFAVGEYASLMQDRVTLLGINKYDNFMYYSAITAGLLLKLYPEGQKDIILGVTHPLDYNDEIRNMIADYAKGKYVLTDRDGKKRVYVVSRVIVYSETEGAISYLSKRVDGETPRFKQLFPRIKNGNIINVIDWGHGTCQQISLYVDDDILRPQTGTARTYDFGGFAYADMLSGYIAKNYKSTIKLLGDRVPFDERLFEAIKTGQYNPYGDYFIDVSEENAKIITRASNDFRDNYYMYNKSQSAYGILWIGGSSKYYAEAATYTTFPKGYSWGQNSKLVSDKADVLRGVNILGICSEMRNRLLRGDFGHAT